MLANAHSIKKRNNRIANAPHETASSLESIKKSSRRRFDLVPVVIPVTHPQVASWNAVTNGWYYLNFQS